MRYRLRRIAPGSALRVGCAVGWLVALAPALCVAIVVVQVLQRVAQAFARIEPLDINVLGQPIARIDFLDLLRLSDTAGVVERLTNSAATTFLLAALLLTVIGALLVAVALLLFSLGYNALASLTGGLEIDLDEQRMMGDR
ncbi:MAG TPA: DUF3566 domain-containing protein [Roseiflexaceae bacterium]|nr:DUF3566 domain-containing protein [Roseiflexaceae bacterium]